MCEIKIILLFLDWTGKKTVAAQKYNPFAKKSEAIEMNVVVRRDFSYGQLVCKTIRHDFFVQEVVAIFQMPVVVSKLHSEFLFRNFYDFQNFCLPIIVVDIGWCMHVYILINL